MGGVIAEDIVVRGRVVGSIRGLRVTLQAQSYIEGDIIHQSLAIEQGAIDFRANTIDFADSWAQSHQEAARRLPYPRRASPPPLEEAKRRGSDIGAVFQIGGRPIKSVRKAFEGACRRAGIKAIRAHLHETRPGSDWFDAQQANPCKDLGNGAIPETTDAAKKQLLQSAFSKAKSGLIAHYAAEAQAIAAKAEALLKKAM